MTVQDIITEINDHGFSDSGTTLKVRAINQAIKNIAYRKPWPFLEKVTTLTFSGSSATPSNTPSDLRAVMKIINTTTGSRIRFKRTDDMEEAYGSQLTTAGVPYFYYFEGTTLKVWQVPSATQTLRLRYLRTAPNVVDSDPESAIIVPPDYHETIVLRALYRLYILEDDAEMAVYFKNLYDENIADMTDALFTLQHDEPEYVHVIDADDYDYDWVV